MKLVFDKNGPLAKSISFRADGSYLEVDGLSPRTLGNEFCIEAWLRFDDIDCQRRATLIDWPAKGMTVYATPGGSLGVVVGGTASEMASARSSVPLPRDAHWKHVAIVMYQGRVNGLSLFLDGVEHANIQPSFKPTGTGALTLSASNKWGFRGAIAQLAVWTDSRSAADVAGDRLTINPSSPNLYGLWTFESGDSKGKVLSNTPSASSLTLAGTRWVELPGFLTGDPETSKLVGKMPIRGVNGAKEVMLLRAKRAAAQILQAKKQQVARLRKQADSDAQSKLEEAHRKAQLMANNARFESIYFMRARGLFKIDRHYNETTLFDQGVGISALAIDPVEGLLFSCYGQYDKRISRSWDWNGQDFHVQHETYKHDVFVDAVQVNPYDKTVFWIDTAGQLTRINIDGTGSSVLNELGPAKHTPKWMMALDTGPSATPRQDDQSLFLSSGRGIYRYTLDGKRIECSVSSRFAQDVMGMVVDKTSRYLYWADGASKRLYRVKLTSNQHNVEALYVVDGLERGLMLDYVLKTQQGVQTSPQIKQDIYWLARQIGFNQQTPGLVGYWPCNERSTCILRDRMPSRHHLTLDYGLWETHFPPLPVAAADQPERVLRLDQAFFLDDVTVVQLTSNSFSIEVWLYVMPGSAQTIAGNLVFGPASNRETLSLFPTKNTSTDNKLGWSHHAFTFNDKTGETCRYINGVKLDSTATRAYSQITTDLIFFDVLPTANLKNAIALLGPVTGHTKVLTDEQVAAAARTAARVEPVTQKPTMRLDNGMKPQPFTVSTNGLLYQDAFTVVCWVVVDQMSAPDRVIFNTGYPNTPRLTISKGHLIFAVSSDSLSSTSKLQPGVFYRVVARKNSSTIDIFINGAKSGSRTVTPASRPTTKPVSSAFPLGYVGYTNEDASTSTDRAVLLDFEVRQGAMTDNQVEADYTNHTVGNLLTSALSGYVDHNLRPPATRSESASLVLGRKAMGAQLPDAVQTTFSESDYTLEFWLRPFSNPAGYAVIFWSLDYRLYLTDGQLGIATDGDFAVGTSLTTNEWNYMSLSYKKETNTLTVLVNAIPEISLTLNSVSQTGALGFGTPNLPSVPRSSAGGVSGAISEIKLWDMESDAETIKSRMGGNNRKYLVRASADGSGDPEYLTTLDADDTIVMYSKQSEAHEKQLLAYRKRHANQQAARVMIGNAHDEASVQTTAAHAKLEEAHTEGEQKITSKRQEHSGAKKANAAKLYNAHADKSRKIATANAGAKASRQKALDHADALKKQAHQTARNLKSNAQKKLSDAQTAKRTQG